MTTNLEQLFYKSFVDVNRTEPYGYCEKVWLPEDYLQLKNKVDNFAVRDDDVWLVGLPKTGTNWAQEMVWCIGNDLDFKKATEKIDRRFPIIELPNALRNRCIMSNGNKPPLFVWTIDEIAQLPSPRFLKSHLSYQLLPKALQSNKTAKIVYVIRNPKDTCVSAYHFFQRNVGFSGSFEDFCNLYVNDKILFTPYWEHLRGFYKLKDSHNVLFLKYEDMKKDLPSVIRRVAVFLGKSLNDNQVHTLAKHLSFDAMKNNPAVNYDKIGNVNVAKISSKDECGLSAPAQLRKGQVDQWKMEMSSEIVQMFNDWTKKKFEDYPELQSEFGSY